MKQGSLILRSFFLLLLLLILSSCDFGSGSSGILNLRSIGEEAVSNSNYFYVDLAKDSYEVDGVPYYDINTTQEFGNGERGSVSMCEIEYANPDEDEDPLTGRDRTKSPNLICILDVPEADLLLKNIKLEYNFPAGMCHHYQISLPWHYNYPLAEGKCVCG